MRVYVITTKNIGEKYIFNSRNRSEIKNDQIADRKVFNDLNYKDITGEDYRFSHKYYYKIADDNFAVIGYAYLPGLNNQRRVVEWKSWLSGLCNNGDEYVFVLHDKDYGQKDTPFKKIDDNTYVFLHEPEDWFYGLLEKIGNDITASDFNRKFNKLVTFAELRQKVISCMDESFNPGIEFFRKIDNLLSTGQIYEQKFEAVNNDWNGIRNMLCEIRSEINRRKYE